MTIAPRYELLLLAVPEITQDEAKDVEKQITSLIKENKGMVISFDRWGKYRLSYPVRKNEYGVYFLARFDAAPTAAFNKELQSLLRIGFDSVIMRNLLTAIDADSAAQQYKRPRSLEEAPQEEGSSILKNKKVEGLISAVDSLRGPRKKNIHDNVSDTNAAYDDVEDDSDEE